MEFEKFVRLSKVLRELNISLDRAVDFLNLKGIKIEARPTTKISNETYKLLLDNFDDDKSSKVESNEVLEEKRKEKEIQRIKLEEDAMFDGDSVYYIDGRQKEIFLIPRQAPQQ